MQRVQIQSRFKLDQVSSEVSAQPGSRHGSEVFSSFAIINMFIDSYFLVTECETKQEGS